MSEPFFSIVVPTYNRLELVTRCIESCLAQTYRDFEVVVVDDGSTDGTRSALEERWDSRIRVVSHDVNRGIDPARYTGVSHARGRWILVVDSDCELAARALQRIHEIILGLPPGVRVVRSRLQLDDGTVTPDFVPDSPVGYEARIRFVADEGGMDDIRCVHRLVLDTTPFFRNRSGAMETLYELNLARNETSVYVEDVLAFHHHDAANSYLRSIRRSELVPRLIRDAPDVLWMAETTLREHGAALRRYGIRQYRLLLRLASLQAFLIGDRRRGLQYSVKCLRRSQADLVAWSTLLLGLVGPRAVAHGVLIYRLGARIVQRLPENRSRSRQRGTRRYTAA
jgi:glycosyltransferase involved in cell wall biosynthesis